MSSKTKPFSSNNPQHHQTESQNNFHNNNLRRKDVKSSRTRKNSKWASSKAQLFDEKVEKHDFDGGFKSSSDFDDVIEKGYVSKSSLDANVEAVVLEKEGSGEGVEKLVVYEEIEDEKGNDPVKRLEELRMSVKDADLTEELVKINNQLQEDELLAMEAIYGDNIVILENQNGLRCFQVNIRVEVPDGIAITTESNSPDSSTSFKVEYLPPIHLTCLLPKSYPSNCAPLFTISVQWLNSTKISDLCHELDSIWKDQSGQEVIYPWVEWLQDCSLSRLGFESEIVLGPYGLKGDQDRRAISESMSLDIDIPSMKSYNDEQHHEIFCRNIHRCCICFSEYPGSDFEKLPCKHFFCLKCLKTFSDMHVREGTVYKLKCPEQKCEGMIPAGLLKRLVGDKEFERWDSWMLQKTLESMKDVVNCPRCETACLEDEDHQAQCSKCCFSFCALCTEKRHVGVPCITPEQKHRLMQERQNLILSQEQHRLREADLMNQLKSIKKIQRSAMQCPACCIAIIKTEGCDRMKCEMCGKTFCYKCAQPFDDHYKCEEVAKERKKLLSADYLWMSDGKILDQLRAEIRTL